MHRSTWTFRLLFIALGLCSVLSSAASAQASPATAVDHRVGVTDAAAPGGLLEPILFYIVAGGAVMSAIGVCVTTNIVRMAIWLFGALASVALLYFMLAANFLGAIQLIIYAGGTLILLIFGVMLTSKSPWARFTPSKFELAGAGLVCTTLFVSLCIVLRGSVWHSSVQIVPGAAISDIGKSLLTTYLVPFEVAGVLLMIVMVGAAHLARQEK